MEREAGHTQGFGRVSPVTRPSPYSPVQFRGGLPSGAGAPLDAVVPTRKRSLGRTALFAVLLAAVAAGLLYFTVGRSLQPPAGTVSLPTASPNASPAVGSARAPAPTVVPVAPRAKGG